MKKLKIAFWILIFVFLALVGYQNRAFFRAPLSLSVDLGLTEYTTPEMQIWVFFIALFLFGILLSYFFSLPAKFRAGKIIKTLNATISSQRDELTALKNEVAAIRNPVPVEPVDNEPLPSGADKV